MVLIWVGVGFAAFGLLVGTTAGLSSAELTTTLLGLLFALIGGSIGVLLGKLDSEGRLFAGVALLTFSVFATIGLYSGIYVRINDLLRIVPATTPASKVRAAEAGAYLKSGGQELIGHLTLEVNRERMTLPAACEVLREQGDVKARP